ncbi:MAG TPA: SRPBCC family protein [Thermoanaerobaculia bacterium]
MLKIIGIIVVAAIAGVLVYASTQPNSFAVERTVTINATPDKIAPLISDFNNWAAWSPFEKLDPAMKKTITGSPSGIGSVYTWEGNAKAGAGRMEITRASAAQIDIKLDFLKPFASSNVTEFRLEPNGNATNVTWHMHGPSSYMTKLMTTFMSMDKMVGKDFEEGLGNLKRIAEK